jgi:tetratricopeptide (TPR) repeat protein
VDYYAQALMFDDTNERASERASLTVGQLANLRRKATDADFSAGELKAAESLAVLADEDEERKRQRLETMLADAEASGRSLTAQAQLEALAGTPAAKPKKKRATPPTPRPTPEVPEVDFEADAKADQPTDASKKARRDPQGAKQLAQQGQSALEATQWKEAERLFHQALQLDRQCAGALIGLSDLHFDRSEYKMALTYAERAVAAAPKNAGFRIKLGDVYYKVLRYDEAKEAYEAAAQLGSSAAAKRLAKLEDKLGG